MRIIGVTVNKEKLESWIPEAMALSMKYWSERDPHSRVRDRLAHTEVVIGGLSEVQPIEYNPNWAGYAILHKNKIVIRTTLPHGKWTFSKFVHTMKHECGHILGYGHSDNPNDVMYPEIKHWGGTINYSSDLEKIPELKLRLEAKEAQLKAIADVHREAKLKLEEKEAELKNLLSNKTENNSVKNLSTSKLKKLKYDLEKPSKWHEDWDWPAQLLITSSVLGAVITPFVAWGFDLNYHPILCVLLGVFIGLGIYLISFAIFYVIYLINHTAVQFWEWLGEW